MKAHGGTDRASLVIPIDDMYSLSLSLSRARVRARSLCVRVCLHDVCVRMSVRVYVRACSCAFTLHLGQLWAVQLHPQRDTESLSTEYGK